MNTLAERSKYDILMKHKSKAEKQKAIDELIDVILEGNLPADEMQDAKEDAQTLAESLLRCSTNKSSEK